MRGKESGGAGRSAVSSYVLSGLAVFVGAFETLSLNSILVGHPAAGALQVFAVLISLVVGVTLFVTPKRDRPRQLSRAAAVATVSAALSILLLRIHLQRLGVAEITPARLAATPLVLLLIFQAGSVMTALLFTHAERESPRWWAPMALGVVVLIVGGFLTGGVPSPPVASTSGTSVHPAPPPADPPEPRFRATTQVGAASGREFLHVDPSGRPLLGLAFDTRAWMGRHRLSKGMQGVFDRAASFDAGQVLLGRGGYAVSGLDIQATEYVNAIRVQFARLDGAGLDMSSAYWSDWVGSFVPGDAILRLGTSGDLVHGVVGTAGLPLNSLGLLIDESASSWTAEPVGVAAALPDEAVAEPSDEVERSKAAARAQRDADREAFREEVRAQQEAVRQRIEDARRRQDP